MTPEESAAQRQDWLARGSDRGAREQQVAEEVARLAQLSGGEKKEDVGPYRLDFGRRKGWTLERCAREDRDLLQYYVAMGMSSTRPSFAQGLEAAGLLADLLVGAPSFRQRHAAKSLERARSDLAAPDALHPEVVKLRQAQEQEALVVLAAAEASAPATGDPNEQEAALVQRQRSIRKRVGRAKTEIHSCFRCGRAGRTAATCLKTVSVPHGAEKRLVQKAHLKNKAVAMLVARLKYTRPALRGQGYETREKAQCMVLQRRCFVDMARNTPLASVQTMKADGLLCELLGMPCVAEACVADALKFPGFSESKTLGHVSGDSKRPEPGDVRRQTVCHRCMRCRARYPVEAGSRLFAQPGHGSTSISLANLAFYNCAIGVSLTHTCLQLNLHRAVVGSFYSTARRIIAQDAVTRQNRIVFGHLGSMTVDVEMDESSFTHYSEVVEVNGIQTRRHYYYVWVGVLQRGDMGKLWIHSLGLPHADGDKAPPPPLSDVQRDEVLAACFNEGSNACMHSDMARTYVAASQRQLPCGIVSWDLVNHGEHEYCRSTRLLADVQTQDMRDGAAGTQTLDSTWRFMKRDIPDHCSVKTKESLQEFEEHIRGAQWRRMLSGQDLYAAFCRAAQSHGQQQIGEVVRTPVFEEEAIDSSEAAPAPLHLSRKATKQQEPQVALVDMVGALSAGEVDKLEAAIASLRAARQSEQASAAAPPKKCSQGRHVCPSFPDGCSSCGHTCHKGHESALCPFMGRAPGQLSWQPDDRDILDCVPGSGGRLPHRSQFDWTLNERFSTGECLVTVDGVSYITGHATSADCNCLIHTVAQVMGLECDLSAVRQALMLKHPSGPDAVRERNYLTLGTHWKDVVHFVAWHAVDGPGLVPADDFYLRCIDLANPGHGEVVGMPDAVRALLFAREGGNHFVPLQMLDGA